MLTKQCFCRLNSLSLHSSPYSVAVTDILVNYCGLEDGFEASTYARKNRLAEANADALLQNIEYCKNTIGYADCDLLENPTLLRTNPVTLEQRFLLMQEGGFGSVSAKTLSRFITHIRQKIVQLKKSKLIPKSTDVAASLIGVLSPKPEGFYVKHNESDDSWSHVYLAVLKEYLKWRLELTDKSVTNLLAVHANIRFKSLRYLCENIKIAEDLGFTPEKICKNGYLLRNYPKYTKDTVEEFSVLAGVDMRTAMRRYPKLVTTPTANIRQIHSILKEFNVSDDIIRTELNVFQLSPDTVRQRLVSLQNVDDFNVLLKNPQALRLVLHHNRAKSRLYFLKQLHLQCSDMRTLGSDDDTFDVHVREGRDINNMKETCQFLKNLLKVKDVSVFRARLKKHSFFMQVPFVRMQETFNHLRDLNYSVTTICHVVDILLYPSDKIDDAFNRIDVDVDKEAMPLSQVQMLNLVVYFIEKEHHFTGNGIWPKSDEIDDEIVADSVENLCS